MLHVMLKPVPLLSFDGNPVWGSLPLKKIVVLYSQFTMLFQAIAITGSMHKMKR